MDSFDKGWFVLQTYSGYENKVKENLLQRAQTYNMLENILRVEIPTQTVQVEKNGKTKEIEENRFPGYVLVEMVMTDEAWFVVRNTPNVSPWVKQCRSLTWMSRLEIPFVSLMVPLLTIQVRLLRLIITRSR